MAKPTRMTAKDVRWVRDDWPKYVFGYATVRPDGSWANGPKRRNHKPPYKGWSGHCLGVNVHISQHPGLPQRIDQRQWLVRETGSWAPTEHKAKVMAVQYLRLRLSQLDDLDLPD
jgi:hypothetical protein